jgi:3-methylfumaryl-CoA hydratase
MTSSASLAGSAQTGTSSRTELITRGPAEALAGLLDLDPLSADEPLPALWHWVYLLERPRQSDLGPDGHPTHGIPAPPGPGQLRMFAGGRVCLRTPLHFDQAATRTTRVVRTIGKQGASGPLTFVTVRSEIEQQGHLAIFDEQDIVYRPRGGALLAPSGAGAPADPVEPGLVLHVDPVLLFRFSALTYNAHRIHYDPVYAAHEGYPGLVVHGPLQALLMGELMRRAGAALVGQKFVYRLVAPTFGEQRLTAAPPTTGGASAQVQDGALRVTATSALRPYSSAGSSWPPE